MGSRRRGVVNYVGYYDRPSNKAEGRYFVLAATNKMDYIVAAMNRAGHRVQIVSASTTRHGRSYPGSVVPLPGGNELRLFRTYAWGGKLRRVWSTLASRLAILHWLLTRVRSGEDVVVYHSLGYAREIALARRLKGFRLVLEVEEIYADVTGRMVDRRRERRLFRLADAFIFPTERLDRAINWSRRPYCVVHGTYRVEEPHPRVLDCSRIHVVYAGTFDPRKGGGLSAAAAAGFLDERYHVHIIGFGTDAERQALISQIDSVSRLTRCKVSYDGLLSGADYLSFLQSCQIGLSTQRLDADFSSTSFPSKVLSYLANGLKVVSIRLPVLEESAVGDLLTYYEEDSPEAIASAIMRAGTQADPAGPRRLTELDVEFVEGLSEVLAR